MEIIMTDQIKTRRRVKLIVTILCVATLSALFATCLSLPLFAEDTKNYIYFDLAAGSVTINDSTYTGYIYQTVNGTTTTHKVTGTHNNNNEYYVYQSTTTNRKTTGIVDGSAVTVPTYDRVTYDGKAWGKYITNNKDTDAVANNWTTAAGTVGRTETLNYITITGNGTYNVTIDNLWSTMNIQNQARKSGGIACMPTTNGKTTIYLKGDNRFGNIHYFYHNSNVYQTSTYLKFTDGETGITPGSMTVVSYDGKANHYCSVIGGNDSGQGHSIGLVFDGGIIYSGGRTNDTYTGGDFGTDNCTAIGGGGNDIGAVTINGGVVTAVSSTTGTAIGGGIGFSNTGGKGYVTITGGMVYAYNLGYLVSTYPVPASAIGGAGSNKEAGSLGEVTITGGIVYAESVGGAAIGGGSSVTKQGGDAVVNISGNAHVTARSVSGIVRGKKTNAGTSIGGGTAGPNGYDKNHTGGNATINISGGTLFTGSIGGGACVHGNANIGNADVTISGGTLQGQVIMAKGANKPCKFTMTGGTLDNTDINTTFINIDGFIQISGTEPLFNLKKEDDDVSINGGAVNMNDDVGVCTITGGQIINCTATNGGAIYMTAGTFNMSGTGQISASSAAQNGGAVYMGGGTANISGGSIVHSSAPNGGAIYMTAGTFTMSGEGQIQNCRATSGNGGAVYLGNGDVHINGGSIHDCSSQNGGAVYVQGGDCFVTGGTLTANTAEIDGGAVCVQNGNFTMRGGAITANTAKTGAGGGMKVSSSGATAIEITSGEIYGNHAATNGGAFAAIGGANSTVTVTLGVNESHFNAEGIFVGCNHKQDNTDTVDTNCPRIENNTVDLDGGAIYIKGDVNENTKLNIYCIIENGNRAEGNAAESETTTRSDFIKVEGGTVTMSTADDQDTSDADTGYNVIHGSIHITGGVMNISGSMVNPMIDAPITVDIQKDGDAFHDTRTNLEGATQYYKVHYHENFREGETVTGQYTAYIVKEDDEYVVRPVMYSHSAYSIKGWNYLAEPDENTPGMIYPVGSTILFSKDNLINIPGFNSEKNELVLYAIWDKNSYYVEFHPNIPAGASYTGKMSYATFSCNATQQFPENTFRYPMQYFLGWSTDKNATQADYLDGTYFEPITTQNGVTIELYAIWHQCPHESFFHGTAYTVETPCTIDGDTLEQTCQCGAARSLTMHVEDSVYNGKPNEAQLTYSDTAWSWSPLPITYTPTKAALENGLPVNADTYTASVTVSGTDFSLSFLIDKAKQDAPTTIPTFTIPDNQAKLIADPIVNSVQSGATAQYRLSYYTENSPVDGDWVADREFSFNVNWTTYYISVRYADTPNYYASDAVTSDMQYVYRGEGDLNILISIIRGEGIQPAISDYKNNEGKVIGVKIDATLLAGYYFPLNYSPVYDGPAHFIEHPPTSANSRQYVLTKIPSNNTENHKVTFSDARRITRVGTSAVVGEMFGLIQNGSTSLTIANDSALTVRYEITNYAFYDQLRLTFDQQLPIGTVLILKDMTTKNYWFYRAESGVDSIGLVDFQKMGGTDRFEVTSGDQVYHDLNYQFTIDFSHIYTDYALSSLAIRIAATGEDQCVPELGCENLFVTLTPITSEMTKPEDEADLSEQLHISFAKPDDISASKWADQKPVLVLRPTGETIGDMQISVEEVIGDQTKTTVHSIHADGSFILPLSPDVSDVTLTLISNFFPKSRSEYRFIASLYASQNGIAPMRGESLGVPVTLTFAAEVSDVRTSVKIGTGQTIYKPDDTVTVSVKAKNIAGYSYEIALMKKGKDGYAATAYEHTGSWSEETNEADFYLEIPLQGFYDDGSYSVEITIRDENDTVVTQVPVYFIILK